MFGRLEAERAQKASKLCAALLDDVLVDGWLSALLEGIEHRSLQELLDSKQSRADLVSSGSKWLAQANQKEDLEDGKVDAEDG